jgi:tRNA-2-methylthio-N6-dimethylallyladenosine synthase
MRDCPRICRYLHVPAQSGSDRILKLMNRGYTARQYTDFIDRARAYMPDISLASDAIVGFPTETDADFERTMELTRYCRFKNSFIFKYSPRPGTIAIDRHTDDVPEEVKRRRNNALLALQGEISATLNREMIGKTVEVMVEGESKLAAKQSAYPSAPGTVELKWTAKARPSHFSGSVPTTQLIGRTRGDQVLAFEGPISLKGRLATIEVTDAKNLTLFGKLAELTANAT